MQELLNRRQFSDYAHPEPIVKRCACGFRIRGKNHENGEHHNKQKQNHKSKRR